MIGLMKGRVFNLSASYFLESSVGSTKVPFEVGPCLLIIILFESLHQTVFEIPRFLDDVNTMGDELFIGAWEFCSGCNGL